MTKAEMEEHRNIYQAFLAHARTASQAGLYREAVNLAVFAWEHIDGMMQYERKYEKREFASIEAIDIVLKYAPLLFDLPRLDALESLLQERRRIDRDTSEDLGEKLTEARELMWDAHRLWNHIEQSPGVRQDALRQLLGGDQERWRSICEAWEKMGLLGRTQQGNSYCLELLTRMGEVVSAKCSYCGCIVEAPKAMLLEVLTCTTCRSAAVFVILPERPVNAGKE